MSLVCADGLEVNSISSFHGESQSIIVIVHANTKPKPGPVFLRRCLFSAWLPRFLLGLCCDRLEVAS